MAEPRRWQDRANAALERAAGFRVLRVDRQRDRRGRVRPPADPKLDRLVERPVFLLSSVRSGSTLLRVVLNSHSRVHAPHETHVRRLEVWPSTEPARQAIRASHLNQNDLEHLLWDRLLHRELVRSGKQLIVEKTPSNVFAAARLATAWPGARFVFLLRHPYSIARSWHEGDPAARPMSRAVPHTLNYMLALDEARNRYPGLTVRYEELTADPAATTRRICDFLQVGWEPAMVDYGTAARHGSFEKGIGDWREKIRTGTVQPGRPLPAPDEVPAELRGLAARWGY